MTKKILLLLTVLCLSATIVLAEVPTNPSERIQWIQQRLDQASGPARVWQYGWATAYGAMTYLYAVQASTLDDDDEENDRYDAVVNACSSLFGFGSMLLDPLSIEKPAFSLKNLPETSDEERRIKLREAETLLKQSADREKSGRSLMAHVLAGVASLAAGIAVACDDDRTDDAAFMFAGSMLMAEIQIFTTPTHATQAWKEYTTGVSQSADTSLLDEIRLSLIPNGLTVSCRF